MSKSEPGEATRTSEILAAIDEIAAKPPTTDEAANSNLVTLSTGIVIEILRPMSKTQFSDIQERFPDPPVPLVEVKGQDRQIENPGSPTYKAKLADVMLKRVIAIMDAMATMCTRVVSIPEGALQPTSQEWADMVMEMGYTPKTQAGLYMLWLRLYAAPTDEDMDALTSAVFRKMGVREEDVQKALDNFRGQGTGPADNESPDQGRGES